MKRILSHFKPSQENLFSICNTVLAIFLFMHFEMPFGLLFMVSVALFTIAMDLVYRWCK